MAAPGQSIEDLLNGPGAMPPPNTPIDFNAVPHHNGAGYAVAAVCLGLTTFAMALRVYTRLALLKDFALEDYLSVAAYGAFVGIIYAFLQYIIGGAFYMHQWNIRAGDMINLAFNIYLLSALNAACVGLVKTAILLEWRRIFVPRGTRNIFWWSTNILLVTNSMLYISGFFVCIFSCTPIELWWNPLKPGTCINRQVFDVAAAAFNFVWDIAIFLLPQQVIWHLQLTKSRKIGLSVIFSLGLLSCACAAGRIYAMLNTDYPDSGPSADTSYTASAIWLWIVPEQTCVFLVFCVPAWPRAFAKTTPLGQVVSTMRSWARVATSTGRTTVSKMKPYQSGSRGERLDEEDGHGLVTYGSSRQTMHKSPSDDYNLSDTRILKTTEVYQGREPTSTAANRPAQSWAVGHAK